MPPKVKKYNAKLKSLLNTKNAVLEDTFEFESDSEEPSLGHVKGAELVKVEELPREDNLDTEPIKMSAREENELAKRESVAKYLEHKANIAAGTEQAGSYTDVLDGRYKDFKTMEDYDKWVSEQKNKPAKVKASQKLDLLANSIALQSQELADLKKLLSEKEKKAEERQKARQAQKALNAKARAEAKAREQKEFHRLLLVNKELTEKQAMQRAIAGVKHAMDTARSNSLVL